jgi:hypothetical protein
MGPSCYQLTRKQHPNAPQNVTGVINGDGSITVNWDKVEGALSYLTHYGDANQWVTSALKYIGYSETNSWTLAAENVPKLEVGDFITVTIQAYHVAAPSDLTEKEKAEFLDEGTLPGSERSDPVMLTKLKTHIAYAYSADGMDRFTTVYPNLNLLKNTKSQSYTSTGTTNNNSSNIYPLDGVVADILNKPITITYNYEITNSVGTWSGSIRPTYGLGGTNQSVSNTNLSGTLKETLTLTVVSQSSYGILTSGLPAGTKVTITNLKVELGSTATPWMPSSSEVTTADWPKYVGTYTDSSESQSENPGDYNWKLA